MRYQRTSESLWRCVRRTHEHSSRFFSCSSSHCCFSSCDQTLAAELQATEVALAAWRQHANQLHAQLRTLRRVPDESNGAPRSMLPLAQLPRRRERWDNDDCVSVSSFASISTFRMARATAAAPEATSPLFQNIQFMLNPKEAQAAARRGAAATLLQTAWRGTRQRRYYHAARAFYGIVNGVVELTSGTKSVPAYTITVVRGGHCWQVSHRFSDWVELDRQIGARLPLGLIRPALPSRMPFRSARITAYRQFALNTYLQDLVPLASRVPPARRTLLNFLSRSHLHWMFAPEASRVHTTPPTYAAIEQRSEVARRLAENALWNRSPSPTAPTAFLTNGHGTNGSAHGTAAEGEAQGGSSGSGTRTPLSGAPAARGGKV